MGLATLRGASTPVDKRIKCGVAAWLDGLDTEARAGFDYAVQNRFSVQAIFDEAKADDDFPLGYNRMLAHINGRCSCGPR